MKKLFLLIPALVLAIVVNATTVNVYPSTPKASDNLRRAVRDNVSAGDTIILHDGTYTESEVIDFNKSLVIMAAANEQPIIAQHYYHTVDSGSVVKFIGIKFDGSLYNSGAGANDHCFYAGDKKAGNELRLEKCEFTGFKSYVLYNNGHRIQDSLIINNCFFYNNVKSCVIFYDRFKDEEDLQTVKGVKITNSTFANNCTTANYSVVYICNKTQTAVSDILVKVDHCTFYNNPVENTDHSAVRSYKSTNVEISNCIFAHPTSIEYRATSCYGGAINNCLTYNLTKDAYKNAHRTEGGVPTLSGNLTGNPHFADAAHNNFNLLNASAARRPDGSVWGDPRWAKAIDTIAVPAILQPVDAMCSEKARCTVDTAFFAPEGHEGESVDVEYTVEGSQYVKWQISIAKDGKYKFTANTYCKQGHNYRMILLNKDETSTIDAWQENPDNAGYEWGGQGVDWQFASDVIDLAKGDYVLKMQAKAWGRVMNVAATYEGGATIAIPDTLKPADAIRSAEAWVDKTGVVDSLLFTARGSEGHNTLNWAKWKFSVSKAGFYKFKANVSSSNGQYYKITVFNSDESATKGEKDGTGTSLGSGDKSFATDNIELTEGNYIVKIANTYNHSEGRVLNIVATYEGGAVTTLPGELLGEDAVIYDNGKLKMTHDENGDLKYGDNSQPRGEYADWSIHVNADCKLTVSFNLTPASTSGHEFLVELRNNVGKIDSVEETELTKYLDVPAAGDYTIRLINRTQWSSAILHSVTFTPYVAPAALEINEAATDNSAWIANVGGAAANVQLIRTFKGGVYNSICVPFEAPMSKIKAAFGDDVELLYLEDANMSGDILNLVFANAPDFYQGTPYLIKPSTDVVNPEFANVNLLAEEAASTSHTGWPASFKGTFIKQDIDADPNNLYLGTDNKLYFSNNDVTIKGLRAYFHVNISNAQQVIKHARIMKGTQVLTDVELVETENNAVKSIENGQLIITIDGVRYNVMGAKIQ